MFQTRNIIELKLHFNRARLFITLILISGYASGQTSYQMDFVEFWNVVNEHYAYLDKQRINWGKVKQLYAPAADTITNKQDFIRLLESVVNELHNGHTSLNVNLATSNRITPSGSDIFVKKISGRFFIGDVRKGSSADLAGLRPGQEITRFNDNDIEDQLKKFLPKYTSTYNEAMAAYACAMLFSGTHDKPRKISVLEKGKKVDYFPDTFKPIQSDLLLESGLWDTNTGYIRINNSLGNNDLIFAFDKSLDSLFNVKKLVLDLTETPGGGNSTVARAIMGRFIDRIMPYQTHEIDEKEYETKRHWTEYVLPRKKIFKGEVILLVGHWTGSMGEGIAIGFDGMKRATIIGTEMGGLLGAIERFTLTETQFSFQIPTERLYHVNGTAREAFKPKLLTSNTDETWKKARALVKPKKIRL